MPKAYWIVRVSVRDNARYPEYLAAARPAFEKFGANFIVRGGAYVVMEGEARERLSWSNSPIVRPHRPVTTAPNIAQQEASGRNTPTPTSSSSMAQGELLPAELGSLLDAVKPLQRQDCIRQLVGAAVQHGTG